MSEILGVESTRAVRLNEFGPPETLHVERIPMPASGPNDIVIRTERVGMIYGDTEVRRGTYYVRPELPWTPGRELAGFVETVGENVTRFRPGDRVTALMPAGGACAERVVVAAEKPLVLDGPPTGPMAEILRLPDRVSFDQALVYLVNFRFAHLIFHAWAKVPHGARVLIHGASGGMGSMMIQLARARGCTIFALCRSQVEAEFCRTIGADHAMDTTTCDYVSEVLRLSDGIGVGYAFNGVGGDTINSDPACVAPFGEILLYGYVAGKSSFDPFGFDRSIVFKTFCADNFFPTGQFAEATAAMLEWFNAEPLLGAWRTLSFDEIAEAHRLLEAGEAMGKITLRP